MLILDRYLLRQFVQIFLICFLSLMGLYVVIDAFGHLDQFSGQASAGGGLAKVIASYYAYHSLAFFDRTSGILAMIAAMFTVTWLQRHQELTAVMAAGISKLRIVKPLLVAACSVSLLGIANRELVIPRFRDEIARDTKDLGGTTARPLEPCFDRNTDILIGGDTVVASERKILKAAFVLPPGLSQYGKQITAQDAIAMEATEDHPAGYLLRAVVSPKQLCSQRSLMVGDQPAVITPRDAKWMAPDQLFVVSQLPFTLLASGSAWRNYAPVSELIGQLNHPATDLGPEVRVAVHARIVQPLMDGTLLMLGLPLMMSRRSRNIFISIGICVVVATGLTLVSLACQSAGGVGLLRPALAAWAPLLLFAPLAAALSQNLRA